MDGDLRDASSWSNELISEWSNIRASVARTRSIALAMLIDSRQQHDWPQCGRLISGTALLGGESIVPAQFVGSGRLILQTMAHWRPA